MAETAQDRLKGPRRALEMTRMRYGRTEPMDYAVRRGSTVG
jgi:hypothetical protein